MSFLQGLVHTRPLTGGEGDCTRAEPMGELVHQDPHEPGLESYVALQLLGQDLRTDRGKDLVELGLHHIPQHHLLRALLLMDSDIVWEVESDRLRASTSITRGIDHIDYPDRTLEATVEVLVPIGDREVPL